MRQQVTAQYYGHKGCKGTASIILQRPAEGVAFESPSPISEVIAVSKRWLAKIS